MALEDGYVFSLHLTVLIYNNHGPATEVTDTVCITLNQGHVGNSIGTCALGLDITCYIRIAGVYLIIVGRRICNEVSGNILVRIGTKLQFDMILCKCSVFHITIVEPGCINGIAGCASIVCPACPIKTGIQDLRTIGIYSRLNGKIKICR